MAHVDLTASYLADGKNLLPHKLESHGIQICGRYAWLSTNKKFHVSGDCLTTSGKQCKFPFSYKGVLHHQCTKEDNKKLWCSTQVDENGDFIYGHWGNCGPFCRSGKYHIFIYCIARENRSEGVVFVGKTSYYIN